MVYRRLDFLQDLFVLASTSFSLYFLIRYGLSQINAPDQEQVNRKARAAAVLRRLDRKPSEEDSHTDTGKSRRSRKEDLTLNQYEQMIAMDVVASEDISVTFEGCGKTMLAKALARESGATFINLHISTLTEKWYGDSNKLVNAVFSLARKLEPSIVFIDEIDAVLGQRRSSEHEASGMVKAEFMTLWDGLTSKNSSGESQRILVLGATNRIQDIDEAILRRMPKKFSVSLPSAPQRLRILGLVLKDTRIDKDEFDLEYLVRVMAGMSGSDIKESCRDAAMGPVRELIRQKRASGVHMNA
ncbi:MAG: hypothetical protein Q9196_004428, partial [Gyalolechia fulgens]